MPAVSHIRLLGLVALPALGCASANDGGEALPPDAGKPIDAATDARAIDAMEVDAPGPCSPVTRDLLTNGNFDQTPAGNAWTMEPIAAPLVTDDPAGAPPHSPMYKVWLGGYEAVFLYVSDTMYQDVVIPMNTTELVVAGQTLTNSFEPAGASVPAFDTVTVSLETTAGGVVDTVYQGGSNVQHESWQPLSHVVPNGASLGGQTIRLRLTSENDFSEPSNFMFDSLALTATYCQ